jgi:tRNA G18 (ribose-2'-O)-methylase SpoU
MRKLTHEEIVSRQGGPALSKRLDFVAILNNVRSLYNVGSIFRSADGAGVSHLYLCGITGYPPDAKISKTALGAERHVAWSYHEDARAPLVQLKAQGYELVLLEQTDSSEPFESYAPCGPVALIVGHEVEGVCESIVACCDRAVEIGMAGSKNSLNVSVAFGIAAFHIKNSIVGAQRAAPVR